MVASISLISFMSSKLLLDVKVLLLSHVYDFLGALQVKSILQEAGSML